jgi:hypothetical protein
MSFCLPRVQAKKFIDALKKGEIDPAKLADMTSLERRAFFEDIVGKENGRDVNALFESKLLLKNQQQGMITWAKTVTGIKESVRRDLISTIEKNKRVLDPEDLNSFLEDLASKKLGVEVTAEEAKQIADLHTKVTEAPANSRQYGHAVLDLHDYIESLKGVNKNIIANVANLPKTVLSTLDFSAPFRQGWGMMSRPQWYTSFAKMFKYAASEGAYRDLQADIIAHPLYPAAKRSGLRISSIADKLSQREEQYMSTLVNKIPGIRASERAYVGFLNKLRFDTFVSLMKSAELRGEDIAPGSQATKDIASVVNDFTGSGNIGTGDKYANIVPTLNASFFSPRKISATVNMLNPIRYVDPRVSPTARRAAIRQLVGSVAITTAILGLLKLAGAKVETDPTSADFGKAVLGKTHFDFTGGNGTYAVLLSRLATGKSKSTTSGKITDLGNPKFGQSSRGDVATQFARNKLSPIASFMADWLYGKNSIGQPFNIPQAALNRAIPLIIQDVYQTQQTDPSQTFAATAADLFGVGVQTY